MKKDTKLLIMLGLGGLAAYFFFVKKPQAAGPGVQNLPYQQPGTDPSVAIAEAQAQAAIAQAEAAAKIAEAQAGEWYTPLVQGVGEGTSGFLSGLPGIFG